ncbi:prephenate dehydrogenase [Solimonas marina]|uniref:Prephenate dehydrogenase/arogenate dehydrogenase family protein n=1 Tax=Solimonas marina TaxID=2714601 RepID=A0A970B8W6_9GAMM|nr:prephenate dehydrogenase/arogenate dehydrogenase family protein [Solimonas marina]NKF22689.1 prephenate dehydrogenase/arogenate dehydrogenase family protein [Solimonas marina]
MSVRHLAIVGLGLIGGSFARALRAAGEVGRIFGYDPDPQRCDDAQRLGIVDAVYETAADAVRDADLVLLAVPVLHTGEALQACLGSLRDGAIVTDVGSTKQSVLRDVAAVCGGLPAWFVAGHPIAGTEKSGVANSLTDLFRQHRVILTPHDGQDAQARARVAQLWQAVGARVVEMDAAAHDAIFAATSHLPHVLAFSFVDMLDRLDHAADIFPNAGGGFRDFTRIASSSPQMWHDVVRANADAVGGLLDRQIEELQRIRQLMRDARWDEIRELFARSRAARERYLAQIE